MLGLTAVSTAQAELKYFTQLDLGMSRLKFNGTFEGDDISSNDSKTNFSQRIALGLDFDGSNRLAFDFSNFGKAYDESWNEKIDHGTASLRAYSIGVTYSYAFLLESIIRPYIGARLGLGFIRAKADSTDLWGFESFRLNQTKFSIGATAGAEYKITDRFSTGAGLEYNRFIGTSPYTLQNFGANVFARYTF